MSKEKTRKAPERPQETPQAAAVPVPAPEPEAPQAAQEAARRFRVAWPSGLHLRQEPSLDAGILAVLPEGAEVTAAGEPALDWLPVETDAGSGWVMAAYLREED